MMIDFSKKILASILSIGLFFSNLICSGCSQSLEQEQHVKNSNDFPNISDHDRIWMEKFFNDLLFDGSMLYTLFGTKALSDVLLTIAPKEEWINSAELFMENFTEEKKQKILERVTVQYEKYDLPKNWDKWISWKMKYPDSRFLFSKRPSYDNRIFSAYVLNVKEALWIFYKYYDVFKRELGNDFDLLEVAFDFENPESEFWNKVLSNHLLTGLLHGYGEKNSWLFSLSMRNDEIAKKAKNTRVFSSSPSYLEEGSRLEKKASLENLSIPPFASYALPYEEDPEILKFKEERKMIQNYLKDKDLVEEVLKKIISEID